MSTTLVVDPDPAGHHLQSVSWLARAAGTPEPVVFLTSRGTTSTAEFAAFLQEEVDAGRVVVEEVFDSTRPPTEDLAARVVEACRAREGASGVARVVHMDADQALKRWWWVARRPLRSLARRPRVHFMLTRYPARLRPLDLVGWRLRLPKALLALAARATGTLDHVVGYCGRDDDARGWVVRRVQDPAFSTAHARDRALLRRRHDLPADERLVGIFGVLSERRNAPMILEGLEAVGVDATLVLAGRLDDDVRAWVEGLAPGRRARLLVRDAYLDNDELDQLVAAVDVVPLALTNNGPSGIMGKAEAAGVPVVTAGSTVRAREVEVLGAGLACELDAASLGAAVRQVLAGEVEVRTGTADPWEAVRRYTDLVLGEAS